MPFEHYNGEFITPASSLALQTRYEVQRRTRRTVWSLFSVFATPEEAVREAWNLSALGHVVRVVDTLS